MKFLGVVMTAVGSAFLTAVLLLSAGPARATETPASLEEGVAAIRNGKNDRALAIANLLLRTNPTSVSALALHGYAEMGLGDKNAALRDFDAAVLIVSDAPELHLARCELLYQLHRLDESIDACSKAISLNPKSVEAYDERALAHDAKNDVVNEAAAIPDVDKAIELAPSQAWAYAERCELKLELHRDAEAMPDCDKSLALDPKNGWTWYQRGTLYMHAGRMSEAQSDFRNALGNPGSPKYAYIGLARTQTALGSYADAIANAEIFIKKFPDAAAGYAARAEAEEKSGNPTEAIADAKHAVSLAKPDDDSDALSIATAVLKTLQP